MNADVLKLRKLLITVFHLLVIVLSLVIAFWLRYDFSFTDHVLMLGGLVIALPIKMIVFTAGGLQSGWWRYVGLQDLVRLFFVNLGASGLSTLAIFLWAGTQFPRSVYVIDFLLCFLLNAGARFSVRIYNETLRSEFSTPPRGVLIYGAGAAGRTLVREIRTNPSLGMRIIGFIDDNPLLRAMRIMDVPVVGAGRDIAAIAERCRDSSSRIDEVIIAMPSATGRQMREAHANCRAAEVACRTIPGIGDLLTGKYLSAQIRSISLEDLLGREPVRLEEGRIHESIAGKSILITGAAGSIGSELCRQVARFQPRKLIAFDQSESELFKIDHELRQKYPGLEIVPIVGDIRESRCIEDVMRIHPIDSVYHAAAYKHVPLMELHVLEAARNNIIGTWNLVKIAEKYQVSNFLMISSDKAVNPISVMGVTKRIAELIVGAMSSSVGSSTNWVSVRFGNVLGSNGSVVPLFQAQIAAGGPVTITHAEMRRYFMSIREAVQLVLQASTMGKGSEIFVLDMGEPIKIIDLAHNMIELAGLVPGEDIEIRFTGLRDGEKLFEEVTMDGENMLPTYHEKIRIFEGQRIAAAMLTTWLSRLQLLIAARDVAGILDHFSVIVPEYRERLSREPAELAKHQALATGTADHGLTSRASLS